MDFSDIKIGDKIFLSGTIYTGRDAAHKLMFDMVKSGRPLPFDIREQAMYYTGPCPPKPGRAIGPCGPTTSSRMDKFTPALLEMGLKITIGKGFRSGAVIDSMVRNKCLYLAAVGGTGALLSKCVTRTEVVAFAELGTEAVYRLSVKDFPATVAIDIYGNNLFAEGARRYQKRPPKL